MPVTVFVTAHDEFAVRAFEAQALDYLVKPLTEPRFRATIARVRERIRVSEAVVVLRDGTEVPVSRRRLAQVKSLLRPPPRRSS